MAVSRLRALCLRLFLVFLSLTAALALVTVLLGDLGELQARILATTLTISVASICSMAGAAYLDQGRSRVPGWLGIFSALLGMALMIASIWEWIDLQETWEATLSSVIVAAAIALTLLLRLPKLGSMSWVQVTVGLCIAIFTLQLLTLIWMEIHNDDGFFRALTTVGILVVLQVLAIPILAKLQPREPVSFDDSAPDDSAPDDSVPGTPSGNAAEAPPSDRPPAGVWLRLRPVEDGIYEDDAGHRYRVDRVS